MRNQLYIAQGDITRVQVDAVAVTQGIAFSRGTQAFRSFAAHAHVCGVDFRAEYERAREEFRGPGFFVRCSDSRAPYGVAFVPQVDGIRAAADHAGTDPAQDDPAARAVAIAIRTAVRGLREQGRAGQLLIGLVAFRMGMGGDRHDRLRSARAQVRAAFDVLQDLEGVDVAFLIPEPSTYAIFLDARRQERAAFGAEVAGYSATELLRPLAAAIRDGECVVFVGAGLSENANLRSYHDLIVDMARELGMSAEDVPADLDAYLDIAQWFRDAAEEAGQADRVERMIRAHFHSGPGDKGLPHPALAHYLLLSLPWRFCVTTNYDPLLEQTLQALRRHPLRVATADQVARTGYRDATFVVKLHGDADGGGIVLSREDYDSFFQRRPDMAALLEGLLLNQTFFFVGYSLRDPNFRQISARIQQMLRSAKRPAYVATFPGTPPYVRHHYERHRMRLIELGGDPPVVGADTETRRRALLAFLDALAEEVACGAGGSGPAADVFLARDRRHPVNERDHPLQPLRRSLLAVGAEVQSLIERWYIAPAAPPDPALEDVRAAAHVLSFVAAQGWRPLRGSAPEARVLDAFARAPLSLSAMWECLADLTERAGGSGRERRQLLISALRYAEDGRTVARLEGLGIASDAGPQDGLT